MQRRVRGGVLPGIVAALASLLLACGHATPYYGTDERCAPEPDGAAVAHRLLLIGDAGESTPGAPVLELLASRALLAPPSTTIVFLGDNIYKMGFRTAELDHEKDVAEAEERLGAQLGVLERSGAEGIFIGGNHDWDYGGRHGWTRMLALDRRLQDARSDGVPVSLLPPAGCPGPRTRDLGGVARLVLIDTQWWLHRHEKPGPSKPSVCENLTEDAVVESLRASARDALESGMPLVIAAHNPFQSHGPHGGYLGADVHLFPFADHEDSLRIPVPVIGTLYAIVRRVLSPSRQDLSNPANRAMVERLSDEALGGLPRPGSPPVFQVGGHDHSLQILEGDGPAKFVVVSGAGSRSKLSRVGHGADTRFAHASAGFVEMDFLQDGGVWMGVFEPDHRAAPNACAQVFSLRIEPSML